MKNELFAKLPTITSEEITEKVGAAKAKAEIEDLSKAFGLDGVGIKLHP